MNDGTIDPYRLLGVARTARHEEIRRAYVALAKRLHPDVNPAADAQDWMKALNRAFATLADPAARAAYDLDHPESNRNPHPNKEKTMENTLTTTDSSLSSDFGADIDGREMTLPAMSVPVSFQQLGVFVLDGSGSMTDSIGALTKAAATNKAVRELFTRFKASNKRDNFAFAVVTFDGSATVRMGITPCAQVDDNADYDPLKGHGGGTFIGGGLQEAGRLAEEFLKNANPDIPASAVIVVLSDGACGRRADTKAIADALKKNERVKVCAAFFGTKGQSGSGVIETLEEIASDPVTGCKTVYDAETLRAFFIASVSAGR